MNKIFDDAIDRFDLDENKQNFSSNVLDQMLILTIDWFDELKQTKKNSSIELLIVEEKKRLKILLCKKIL